MELFPKARGRYENYPPLHPALKAADLILDPLMQTVSRGVLSHAWHWDTLPFDPRFKDYAVLVPGNPKAPKSANGPAGDLIYWAKGHFGANSKGYLFDVDMHKLPTPFVLEEIFYCFSDLEMSSLNRSRIALNRMFMMLTVPDYWYAYLMDKNGNPLPAKLLSPLISWDEKPYGIAIL